MIQPVKCCIQSFHLYLKSIGFSIVTIGILEGIAEATAGLSKGYFGKLSDITGKRLPFVQLGYALTAISKSLMVLFITPLWVFTVRTLDRLGKGLRTGARDAILSDEATMQTKGKIFGFHVLGPLFALLYLQWHPHDYKTLFFIAFTPGLLAVGCSPTLKDNNIIRKPLKAKPGFLSFSGYWKQSPGLYRKLVVGLLLFTKFYSQTCFFC